MWDGIPTRTHFPWKQLCRGALLDLGTPPLPSFSSETPPSNHPAPNPAHLFSLISLSCVSSHTYCSGATNGLSQDDLFPGRPRAQSLLAECFAHQSTSSAYQLWHKHSHHGNDCDLSKCPHHFCAFIIMAVKEMDISQIQILRNQHKGHPMRLFEVK